MSSDSVLVEIPQLIKLSFLWLQAITDIMSRNKRSMIMRWMRKRARHGAWKVSYRPCGILRKRWASHSPCYRWMLLAMKIILTLVCFLLDWCYC